MLYPNPRITGPVVTLIMFYINEPTCRFSYCRKLYSFFAVFNVLSKLVICSTLFHLMDESTFFDMTEHMELFTNKYGAPIPHCL